jgi:hypothetical protein
MRKHILFLLLSAAVFGVTHAQKGEKNISAGPVFSFPAGITSADILKPGIGIEVVGQSFLSQKSSILLTTSLVTWGYQEGAINYPENNRLTVFTIQGGYRHQAGNSGIFLNGLLGVDIDLSDGFLTGAFGFGAGKRLIVKENRFIDIGIDFIGADAAARVNLKILLSLFRKLSAN